MKKIDLQLIAEFLEHDYDRFSLFLETEKEIEGSEAEFIIETLIEMIDGLEDAGIDTEEELLP